MKRHAMAVFSDVVREKDEGGTNAPSESEVFCLSPLQVMVWRSLGEPMRTNGGNEDG